MADLKVDDIVYVKRYARCRFRIKEIKKGSQEPYHLVYAATHTDKESEFGWCSREELSTD